MIKNAAKSSALVIGGLAAGTAVGMWHGSGTADDQTRVQILPCGLTADHPAIAVPRGLLDEIDGTAPISLGPMTVAGLDSPVTLRFVAVSGPQDKRLVEHGNSVSLPILAGAAGRVPDEITLVCRYGRLSAASYRYGDGDVNLTIPSVTTQVRAEG